MKRDFLEGLNLDADVIDKIMAENGKDVQREKAKYADYDDLKTQLEAANKTIEKFKDYDQTKAEIEKYKADIEKLQKDSAAKIAAMERSAKVKDYLSGKKFVNDITRDAIAGKMSELLNADESKGKNLDALQLLANIYAGHLGHEEVRVILDTENYRIRREESLVRLAYTTADKVRTSRSSVLLEPMNPFERRLIHTTLNEIGDVETKSEGEGLYKQVRVLYKGF